MRHFIATATIEDLRTRGRRRVIDGLIGSYTDIEQHRLPRTGDITLDIRKERGKVQPTFAHRRRPDEIGYILSTTVDGVRLDHRITYRDFKHYRSLCDRTPIFIRRWSGLADGVTVDEFINLRFDGLVLARVSHSAIKPDWVGAEVTEDYEYDRMKFHA